MTSSRKLNARFDALPRLAQAAKDGGLIGKEGKFASDQARLELERTIARGGVPQSEVADLAEAVRIFVTERVDFEKFPKPGTLAERAAIATKLPAWKLREMAKKGGNAAAASALARREEEIVTGGAKSSAHELVDVVAHASGTKRKRALAALCARMETGEESAEYVWREALEAGVPEAAERFLPDFLRRKPDPMGVSAGSWPEPFRAAYLEYALSAPAIPLTAVVRSAMPSTSTDPAAEKSIVRWWAANGERVLALAHDPVRGLPHLAETCRELDKWADSGLAHRDEGVRKIFKELISLGFEKGVRMRTLANDCVSGRASCFPMLRDAAEASAQEGGDRSPETLADVAAVLARAAGDRRGFRSETDEKEANSKAEKAGEAVVAYVVRRVGEDGMDEAAFLELGKAVFEDAYYENSQSAVDAFLAALAEKLSLEEAARVLAGLTGKGRSLVRDSEAERHFESVAKAFLKGAKDLPDEDRLLACLELAERMRKISSENKLFCGDRACGLLVNAKSVKEIPTGRLLEIAAAWPDFSRPMMVELAERQDLSFAHFEGKKFPREEGQHLSAALFRAFQNEAAASWPGALARFAKASDEIARDWDCKHGSQLLAAWFSGNDAKTETAPLEAYLATISFGNHRPGANTLAGVVNDELRLRKFRRAASAALAQA